MADALPEVPRRPLQYVVRGLLVLSIVLLLALIYYSSHYFWQHQAIRATEALGGTVHFNDGDPRKAVGPRGIGGHLRAATGRIKPVWLQLAGQQVTGDAVDECILPLESLTLVGLRNVAISNQDLLRLAALKNIEYLRCTRDNRNEALLNALDSNVMVDCVDMPLADVLFYLADYCGVPFRIDPSALKTAGIDPAVPMTYKTPPQIRLEDALGAMLAPVGLGWYLNQGQIVVTSQDVGQAKRAHVEALRRALPKLQSLQVD